MFSIINIKLHSFSDKGERFFLFPLISRITNTIYVGNTFYLALIKFQGTFCQGSDTAQQKVWPNDKTMGQTIRLF